MRPSLPHLPRLLLASFCVLARMGEATLAAELAPPPAVAVETPLGIPSGWTFRFTPYGWLTSFKGTQTVRGRSVTVDVGFLDILEKTDTLAALKSNFEARNGRFALYGDLVWSKIGLERSDLRTRTLAPGVTATLGASLGLDYPDLRSVSSPCAVMTMLGILMS